MSEAVASRVNVSRFLDGMAIDQPDVAALKIPRGRTREGAIDYLELSFAELAREQDAWAAKLRAMGVTRGDRTLLMVKPGLPLIAICFALFKLGAVPIVIDPGMGLKNFLKCVRRSKPEYLVGITLATVVSHLFRPSFASVRKRLRVGGPLSVIGKNERVTGIDPADTKGDDLAAILFTSGSTGAPKGVCYEHGMFEGQVEAIRDRFGIQPGEVDLPMLPIFALFNPALGMTTVVPEINPSKPATVDPQKIVQAIQQCHVTNSFGSPALWKKIGMHCAAQDIKLPSLNRILMAGAPVSPDLMEQFREILSDAHTYSPYGATEVLPVSAIADTEVLGEAAAQAREGKGTCVGKLLPRVQAKILPISGDVLGARDLETELPLGQIGEIVVTGPTVTKEYDQLPEATRKSKIVAGETVWHRMGDLGYFDDMGYLWFCGRKVEMVVTPTRQYYTDCCEGVFNQHPKAYRTALVASDDGVPAIVVEPIAGAFPSSKRARAAFCVELKELGQRTEMTRSIDRFCFHKSFPVDVRHNAKIHRLTLAKQISRKAIEV